MSENFLFFDGHIRISTVLCVPSLHQHAM
ncbi:MAG: hypothetical protein FIB08_08430 [Candidatus Methanoperedens sp.]|nr:hypothetical protein [Candidatus Methanoperedens sp.]